MCEGNKANVRFLFYLFAGLLLSCIAGALRAEERESWYLILESELRSIEQYKRTSEAEKRNWLLLARELKAKADGLRLRSESLNAQLSRQRELNKTLSESFNELEKERLRALSLKNGEIAGLRQKVASKTLEVEKHKRKTLGLVIAIIILAGTWIAFIAFKVCRLFRLLP
jgi:citrate synthase